MGSTYLGQNFLKDVSYINFIVQKIEEYRQQFDAQALVEIGPGKGALTKRLLGLNMPLILCERDPLMMDYLNEHILPPAQEANVTLILGDVLEHDPEELVKDRKQDPASTIVAGNLPYYITSPILTQFFGGDTPLFPAGIFMIQKEVADKIESGAEKKSFLRRLLNYHYEVRYLKTVPAKAFSPAPKVQSAIISLIRKKTTPGCHLGQVRTILERISMYKRKTLGKSRKMADAIKTEQGLELNLEGYRYVLPDDLAGKRIEEVSREEMERICQ